VIHTVTSIFVGHNLGDSLSHINSPSINNSRINPGDSPS
jgi:hypothetical protein